MMHEFLAWPLAVVIIVLGTLWGFRKSVSKVIEGIKLRKAPGLEFDQTPQQQIEESKNDSKLVTTIIAQKDETNKNDIVLWPKIVALRNELDNYSKDPTAREKLLIQSVATWQANHEYARLARFIFGSQLEILLYLNSHPNGENWENLRTGFYDKAAQNFPETFKSYTFEAYMAFLGISQLVKRDDQRVTITPRAKAFLHYLVASGDTMPRPN
jgi:hypothetical protein